VRHAMIIGLPNAKPTRDATRVDPRGTRTPHPPGVNLTGCDVTRNLEALRLNYSTTRSPWSVLFSRRPPSSVTVTMSSMRTPNLPAR
jgi:hypothetical protein